LNFLTLSSVSTATTVEGKLMTTKSDLPFSGISRARNKARLVEFAAAFNSRFPTDADAEPELRRLHLRAGLIKCPRCGCADIMPCEFAFRKVGFTCICGIKIRWSEHTFARGIRRPRIYLAYLMLTEQQIFISSSQFAKIFNCAQSSALMASKKIARVITDCLDEAVQLAPSSLLGASIGKRSTETPAGMPPAAEELEFEKSEDISIDMPAAQNTDEDTAATEDEVERWRSILGVDILSGKEKQVHSLLSDKPLHFDWIIHHTGVDAGNLSAAVTMLEMANIVVRLPGDHYMLKPKPEDKLAAIERKFGVKIDSRLDGTISTITDFIKNAYHAISRKCLQLYVSLVWCQQHPERWRHGGLIDVCLRHAWIKDSDVHEYITPRLVRVPLEPALA
jgi:hypothetical protein